MGDPRPENPEMSPADQAAHLTRTGNGPTVDNEEQLLADEFGEPNADGIYGAPQNDGGGAA